MPKKQNNNKKINFKIIQDNFKNYFSRLGTEFKNLRIEYKVAIIGGIIAINSSVLSTILTESGVIKQIVKDWRLEEITISASQKYSGTASKTSKQLAILTPIKPTSDLVIGDDSKNHQSKLFLDFSLENIRPTNLIVKDVQIKLPCEIVGDISKFGRIALHQIVYDHYRPEVTFDYPPYFETNGIQFLLENEAVSENCKLKKVFYFNHKNLVTLFNQILHGQLKISNSDVQFMIYFENPTGINNKKPDGIRIIAVPELKVKYEEQ